MDSVDVTHVACTVTLLLFLVTYAQGQNSRTQELGLTMKSREVDMRVQFEIEEEQPPGTVVGTIPTKPNFTYRFNDKPKYFQLNKTTGTITTNTKIDRENLVSDRFDLVILSSQPTYPIEVRIRILDVNDNAPVFPETSLHVTFSESANIGTRVILDTATDGDVGTNDITTNYKIVHGNEDEVFKLVVTTNPSGETPYLHLETTGKFDREDKSNYQLNISAQDGGSSPRFGFLQVNVTVLDVNDNPPIFDHSDYSVSVNESVPPGTTVLQVRATDNDIGDNARITYFLSQSEVQFAIDPQTGIITTLDNLDCQKDCPGPENCPKSCVFTVFARDYGSPRQDGRAYVTVNLLDANDHDPIIRFRFFPATAKYATVDENAQNGSVVAAVSVIDFDEGANGETSVEIHGGNEQFHFRLESTPSFDIVRVNGILDREQISKYNLTITAKDMGSPTRSSTAFLIIHVNDVNDHEPVFERTEYAAVLSELVPVGTFVAAINAVDEDTGINSHIYYSIASGNKKRWFNLDFQTGLITTAQPLNREEQDFVELKISARDGGPNPRWAHTYLKIQLLDENDEAPTFSEDIRNLSLSESAPTGSLITVLSASDNDLGMNGSLKYVFAPETLQQYSGIFYLDDAHGRLTTRIVLDREIISLYTIKVVAMDKGTPPLSSTVTLLLNVLDVNDNDPVFYPKEYYTAVKEDVSIGTSVVRVTAVDQDEGLNGLIRFFIISGANGSFEIEEATGVIKTSAPIKQHLKTKYKILVGAINEERRSPEPAVVLVYVQEEEKNLLQFEQLDGYDFLMEEDPDGKEPNIGREVGRVSLVPNKHSYDVKFSIASGDFLNWFKIEDGSGIITTVQQVDREIQSEVILTIVAHGSLGFSESVVNVTILDINDYPPTFEIPPDVVKMFENWPIGHEVHLVKCRDLDLGSNSELEFSLTTNPENTFSIDKNTGMIYLNRLLRFMSGTEYRVKINVTDKGVPSLTSVQELVVMVDDVNDHTPVFDQVSYETSLLESTKVNDRFFALRASDGDTANNGHISYEIIDGNEHLKFGIFPDGQLYVRKELDRERQGYYSLTVQAKDNGTKPRSSDVSVVIHIIDENDNKPQFRNDTFVFYVAENEPPDTYIGRLIADDEDRGKNAELTFSITTNQNDFTVDPKTGLIRTLHEFDREKLVEVSGHDYIAIEAVVLDGGLMRLKDEAKVIVYITDVNDNSPQFQRTPYHTTISEGASLQTQVVRVSATDIDRGANGNVLYSILSGNEEGSFLINYSSGQITVVKTLDRERTPRFILTVLATDTEDEVQHTSTATVTIDVLDENDNPPVFQVSKQSVEIPEDTPVGFSIFTFSATDSDQGANGVVSYSISSGNIKETFKIDNTDGVLSLDRPLDYEEQIIYYLNISASDGGAPRLTSSTQFLIRVTDVNDNQPIFPNIAIVRQIEEGVTVNTPVVTITAEDKDSGRNGDVRYLIKEQEPPGGHFAIEPETGVITTIKEIDREYSDTFILTVVAFDQALSVKSRLSSEKTVTIIVEDINDNAPTFVSMDAGVLPEASDRGYVIMKVAADDRDTDTNGMVTYELVEEKDNIFILDGISGELYLSRSVEQPQVIYSLTVEATDEATSWNAKTSRNKITIIGTTKRERGPVFTASEYSGSVFENEPVGTVVLSVRAQYPSGPAGNVEYYLTAIYGNGLPQNRVFAINRKNGVITTAVVLDREDSAQVYELEIYAVDVTVAIPKTSKTKVTIIVQDRNDSPPRFMNDSYKVSLFEDIPVGHTVMTISATDPDLEGELSYSLAETQENPQFQVDSRSGILIILEPLDREIQKVHHLVVQASDGVQTSRTEVTVTITDTNDNPPEFEHSVYSFDVPEEIQRGASVGKVSATDKDIGVNGQISYSVLSDWGNDIFSLNPQTGVFILTSHLDYEQVQHYIFVVQAQDSGQPILSSTVTVYFNVQDLNDNTPLFDPMSYTNEVYENVTVGTSIISVSASDLDSGDNGKTVYAIVEGDTDNQFGISANGTIFTSKPLDRETKSFYNLIVSATDQAWPEERRLSSTVQVTIILKDINDESPEFTMSNTTSVLENVPVNTVIMAVKAVDRDEGKNSYIEYSLFSAADNRFLLGPVDGLLRVNGPLDREIKSQYEITVTAKDRGIPSRSSFINIVVNILDENDNSPTFDPRQYSASVSENTSIGLSVLEVSATDQDKGLSGQVRYSIIAGDTNLDFVIGEDTGIIRVGKTLDYERKNRYTLTVQAEDAGDDVRYDTATVTISVTDINDNPPTFLNSPHEIHVMENIKSLPAYLVTLTAEDADFLPNNNIHYLIKDADKSLFAINSTTGQISLMRMLDREQQSQYTLSVLAMDSGSPRQTGTGTVTVVVSDENDNEPVFGRSHYVATVMENLPPGSEVITVTATDADIGSNSILTYTLLGDNLAKFEVDPYLGTIKTHAALDREEKEIYEMVLVAKDSGLTVQHSTHVHITIEVGDENDNYPIFSEQNSTVYLPDNALAGHFVLGPSVHDIDAGMNSKLVYHLSGTDTDKFQINQDTGIVKIVQKLSHKPEGYHIEIHATDNSPTPLSSTMSVQVYLKPAQLFPVFQSGNRQFVFSETAVNTSITTVSATSPKSGEAGVISYHFAGGSFEEAFEVDSQNGRVWLLGGLDYEISSKFELWIEARDSDIPYLRSAIKIEIKVTDVNDNSPVFDAEVYNATVMEEQDPPQDVFAVQARDADNGKNSEILYHLMNTEGSDVPFSLDSTSGKIYIKSVLDREEIEVYKLIVKAVDQGVPSKTGTATVFVTVLDKNDNPPRFTRLFSVNVTENAPLGTFVIQVTSSDKDISMNANATYSFTENPGGKFHIDPLTGNVTVVGWLDREVQDEYLLKVVAVDGSWRAETTLTITIQDINDNAPVFSEKVYTFNYPELQTTIGFVGRVSAVDLDKHGPNSMVTYSLKRPSNFFRINPSSGEILSKEVLHYKISSRGFSPENQHRIQVIATDHGKPPLSMEVNIVINIVDSNNNPPLFQNKEYFTPVTENVGIGTSVIQVIAKDNEDVGVNAEIEYQKTGGNGTAFFSVHKTTGWVTVADSLLGQQEKWFLLKLQATDKGVPPKSSEVLLSIIVTVENHYAPVFTALSYQVIVPENEPANSEIITVKASDKDRGLNGEIIYSIVAGNNDEQFHISPKTGSVSIQKPLDYENGTEFHLNITATDRGFQAKHTTSMLTVIVTDINDNPPLFNASLFSASVLENEPPGTYITQLVANDADSSINSIIQYSVIGERKQEFVIDPQTGVIASKHLFDYEEKNIFTLEIMASNPGSSQYSTTSLRVYIIGQNEFYPRFVQPVFQFTVSESATVGSPVGSLLATDEDSGPDGDLFFVFVGSSNDRGFLMQSETGQITVARRLDRESQSRVILSVIVKNRGSIRGNDTDEAQVVISIQDDNDPPVFSLLVYEIQVSEAAELGSKVITVSAVDKDVNPENSHFAYSIIAGNINQVFGIDHQSGTIYTAGQLDRESLATYNLTIAAVDNGSPPQTGTTIVQVLVTDVNDNAPIFDPPDVIGYVMENEPPFTSVMVLSASDYDMPPNGAPFLYFLTAGKHQDFFQIDHHTGLIKTTQSIDRESTPNIELLVEVHDSGLPPKKAQHPINIVILDKNDSPSSVRTLTVLVWIFNKKFPGGKIADVHPSDPDLSGNYQCTLHKGDINIFRIPSKCDLHVVPLQNPQNYVITVKGNDGQHADVIYTTHVQFMKFDNLTIENSVTVQILNQSTSEFLMHKFQHFEKALKDMFKSLGVPMLYSLTAVSSYLELTVAVRTNTGNYISEEDVFAILKERKTSLQNLVSKQDIIIGFDPCKNMPCKNSGKCNSYLELQDSLSILDSPSLIFTSPAISRQFSCTCPKGFSGTLCQYQQNPCSPNPCLEGGTCHHDGQNFQCDCHPKYQGKRCEVLRTDVCASSPCENGGTCEEAPNGLFFCLCRPDFRGTVCEHATDSCRPNRCLNGGTCIVENPGYRCACRANYFGRHCEKSPFGFHRYSYMAFPALRSSTNDISIVLSTNKRDSLLVYNYGRQSGGRSDFVALELHNGKPAFSFGGARTAVATIRARTNVADGKWHKITVIRNGRVTSLSVVDCSNSGDVCKECSHGNTSCSVSITGHTGSLNFNENPMYFGGIPTIDPLLEQPGQVSTDDFVGCVHSVSVNGRQLDLSSPVQSSHVTSTCERRYDSCAAESTSLCGEYGTCQDLWFTTSCICPNGQQAPNCKQAFEPISVDDQEAFIELVPQEELRRFLLRSYSYYSGQKWKRSISRTELFLTKSLSITFRSSSPDGLLIYASTENEHTILQLRNKVLVYSSHLKSEKPVTLTFEGVKVTDGLWHSLTLTLNADSVNITLDQESRSTGPDNKVHDFLDPFLTVMTIGGHWNEITDGKVSSVPGFQGCIHTLTINKKVQGLNLTGGFFRMVPHGNVHAGCSEKVLDIDVASTDPLSIGVILVIVFFVILLVVIMISFFVFRRRKQQQGKPHNHIKPQGNAFLATAGIENQRSHQDSSYNDTGQGDDVTRSHLPQDLVPKKMKDRDVPTEWPQRPDIIEREVIQKSSSMSVHRTDDLSLQDASKASSGFAVHDINGSDIPEHYDLENASSIAPSDIDIVYHYKGFHDGNPRKYKTNPHIPNYHKHNHRHSPHQFQPSPIRESPRSVLHQSPNSIESRDSSSAHKMLNTPLARLSPSSELSHQTPRILTLQDISGKPLQTALLATSQVVGSKDPINNSERSLNSPVSNLSHSTISLHSCSQSGNKKKARNSGITLCLTAEEIDRLNAHPRNSSLVSTLDVVSSSSDGNTEKNKLTEILETNTELLEAPDSTTDESGNDSFTCSEFEYDNNFDKVHRDFGPGNMIFSKLAEEDNENEDDSAKAYDGFDSIRGSLSTLVASDDDFSNLSSYKPSHDSVLGWDYLLNWGPNFQSLVGVFKDIAELPDTVNTASGHSKPGEEYV